MSAPPVPFRTSNDSKYTASFPSIVYYRDTFGLEPIHERRATDSVITDCSDDTVTTKSTVRTTVNIHQVAMNESMVSKMTPSYHIEQILTNHVLVVHPRTILTLTLIMFATAINLLIFAMICIFFDGCPFYLGLVFSILMILNAFILFAFLKCWPTRCLLTLSCVAASLSVVAGVALFFWTAYLLSEEDNVHREREPPTAENRNNPIVVSTRIAMYSMQLIFAPIHALAAGFAVYFLYTNLRELNEHSVIKGFFFSEPQIGHQKILVPIELKQIRDWEDEAPDNASIGVQTSGTRHTID